MSDLLWRRGGAAVLAAILAAPAAQAALPQAQGCVTAAEMEDIVVTLAPDILASAGRACAASLPDTALLRRPSAAMMTAYRTASTATWGKAAPAIWRIWPRTDQGTPTAGMTQAAFSAAIAPSLVAGVDGAQCPMLDRLVTLLAPLPPRNMAGVVSLLMQIGMTDSSDEEEPALSICPVRE